MRILFMGTPEFAREALSAIAKTYPGEIVGVVTRQDTPKNRGHAMTPPPVKILAQSLDFPVYQPVNLKEENFRETLEICAPDIIIVAAYGRLLPAYVLNTPRFGCVNIHASLLPKYRGAAPIQRAILAGETEIGVTIMKMEAGLDTGDMYEKASFSLTGTENYGEIHDRLAALGAELITDTMNKISLGAAHAEKQDDSLATYAAKIEKEDRLLTFDAPAEKIINKIRAFSPIPGAEAALPTGKVKITAATRAGDKPDGAPGTVSVLSAKGDGRLAVNCKDDKILLGRLIPEGKKEMSAGDFIRGRRIEPGDRFLSSEITESPQAGKAGE